MSTAAAPFGPEEDPSNPNVVKVVVDRRGRALYFSRALVPHPPPGGRAHGEGTDEHPAAPLRHLGLYVYRRPFLETYVALEPTPLERTERLEQLRVLEHGYRIAVALGTAGHDGIDTPEQYEAFVRRWRQAAAGTRSG